MKYKRPLVFLVLLVIFVTGQPVMTLSRTHTQSSSTTGQQIRDPKPDRSDFEAPPPKFISQNPTACATGCVRQTSPFSAPKPNDSNFVVDCDAGLDTGCTFRSGGPLVFKIKICRVVGNVQQLKANGLIAPTARLELPAFDVDFVGGGGSFFPERDRIFFNGHRMNEFPGNGEFLTGSDNTWKLNGFNIPVEWINFASEAPGMPTPGENIIQIDIDTANTEQVWCTAIDWAALSVDVARPVVFVHGILSDGGAWAGTPFSWINKLDQLGLPNTNNLSMGALDSIQNNAGKIETAVNNACRRWGVDKINLVCHSKGGLDSRHFVERNNSVERVIQLGTPNAGSPLADVAQGISTLLIGPGGTAFVNVLLAPAGRQLTTWYMRSYNNNHGRNPKVKYTALAGRYDQDCPFFNPLCRGLDSVFLGLTGVGDTIVPASSVHSLGYTENRFFDSSGEDKQATHTSLNSSLGVFNRVMDRVKAFGTNAALTATITPPVARTVTVLGTIQQGQVQTQIINIDQSTPTSFSVLFPSGNLDLALISPSGQRFDSKTIVGNPNVTRSEQEILGGQAEAYNFTAPEVGAWTVEVKAPSVIDPSGSVTYALIAWLQNPTITFSGAVATPNVSSGTSLRLLGTLKNGTAPITGATVNARIGLPDFSSQVVSLRDDGTGGDATANDGIYSSNFSATSQPGSYRVLFTASRPAVAGQPAFSREDFALATVSQSSSTFTGSFRDFGVDTNGNGLFNNLIIEADVNITAAANYRVFGTLTDSHGNTHQANTQAMLTAGPHVVSLSFDGESLFNNRVDGPYRLSDIRLVEETDLDILPVDARTDAFQTTAYDFRRFEHGPIFFTGTGSSVGIDNNGNGLFDLLNVGIGIEVANAGFYSWSASLVDSNGKEIGFASSSASLAAGANTLSLVFDGEPIGRNGIDGPYFIRGLLVFGPSGSLVVSEALTTNPFLARQFEGSFNIVLQDESNGNILLINSTSGNYQFLNCRKGTSMNGLGRVTINFCKIELTDSGPIPKRPDRNVQVVINPCTRVGNASIQIFATGEVSSIVDIDITNNNGVCSGAR